MKKEDLVNLFMEKAELRKKYAESALRAVFEGIATALEKGESVTIKDFGTFQVTERAAREGRNPQTGEKINIAASKTVKFKPGKNLKERVKYKFQVLIIPIWHIIQGLHYECHRVAQTA